MMYTTNYTCTALRKKDATTFALVVSLALIAFVAFLVFTITQNTLTGGMKGMYLYCLIASLVFTGIALTFYFTQRIRIRITGANDKLTLSVKDPTWPDPIVIESPFSLQLQWIRQPAARRLDLKIIYVTILSTDGSPLITFTTALGSAYDAPPKFEQATSVVIAGQVYDTSKAEHIAYELGIYLTFMLNREKKKNAGNT